MPILPTYVPANNNYLALKSWQITINIALEVHIMPSFPKLWSTLKLTAFILTLIVAAFSLATWATSAQQGGRDRVSDAAHKRLGTPYIHLGDNVLVHTVYAGEIFYVWNNYVKPDTCRVTVTNLFVDVEKKRILHQSVFANWFKEGTYEFNEIFEVPVWLPPSHYHIVKKSVSWCNNLETYTTNFDIEIDIQGPRTGKAVVDSLRSTTKNAIIPVN